MYVPPAPVRRALAPLAVIMELAALALFAAVAAICGLAWPLTRRHRALRLSCFAGVYLVIELSVLAACAWHWLRRLATRASNAEWTSVHTGLFRWALTVLLDAARALLHFEVDLMEPAHTAPLQGDEPVLVLARHGGPGDSLALVHLLLTRYHRFVRIVLKELLACDPALDVLLTRLNCVFLPARSKGKAPGSRLARAAADLIGADTLLLFPEGNNWTPARRARLINHLRRVRPRRAQVAEQLEYVLPPRAFGAFACLKTRPGLPVVFFAHTGLDELVTLKDVWQCLPFATPMTVQWWNATARPVFEDYEAVEDWLLTEWAIIDQWIGVQAGRGRRLATDHLVPDHLDPEDLADP